MIRAGRRGGKAQPLTAKVYTPAGPVLMGNIKLGDEVLTPFGESAFVENIFPQGVVDIYKITFNDGAFTECTADHLWEITRRMNSRERTEILSTIEIKSKIKDYMSSHRPKIILTETTNFKPQEVPIDPYLLGLLIGDGTIRHEIIGFTTTDDFILGQVEKRLPDDMHIVRDRETINYRIVRKEKSGVGKYNNLIQALKGLGLFGKYSYEKFIPDIYKYNSVQVRMALVQGILDTDGWINHKGQAVLNQTSKRLADDFAEIIQSLGGACSTIPRMGKYKINGEIKETRLNYKQYIYFDDCRKLFTLPRKVKKCRPRARKLWRYIRKIEVVRQDQAQCIKISDPRGLYLTDNFIVTHNTVGIAIGAVLWFLQKKRVLYTAPTSEQIARFWFTVTKALEDPIDRGVLYKNESLNLIKVPGTENQIRAKTAWNADTLRGDYADILILDEWQLMNEEAWELVGAPMMLDTNGSAVFIYTPPSLRSRSTSKASDPQHAAKRFKKYKELQESEPNRYATFHFTSHDNPHLSQEALDEVVGDMTSLAHRMEILAEDVDEVPGALWTRETIEKNRITTMPRDFDKIVVAVDPSASSTGDETGIITVGKVGEHGYTLADNSVQGSPMEWAKKAVAAYYLWNANKIIAEKNNGGEMVSNTIHQVDRNVPVELVFASRGKATRAEPVSAMAEHGKDHHVGHFPYLEDELCLWTPQPGKKSPNRLDAKVWGMYGVGLAKGGTNWDAFVG